MSEDRNAADIAEIQKQIYGLPQEMAALTKTVNQLCENVAALLIRLEDKHPTKEMCVMCQAAAAKELGDCKEDLKEVSDKVQGITNWLLAGAVGIIISLLIFIFGNLDKLFAKGGG